MVNSFEHASTILGYNCLTFDPTLKSHFKDQTVIPKEFIYTFKETHVPQEVS